MQSETNLSQPLLISTTRLGEILGVGKTKIFELIANGEIETVLIGRRRMAVLESARRYVEKLREQARAAAEAA